MGDYQDRLTLPWTQDRKENNRFKAILFGLALVTLIFSLWIPFIELKEKDRETLEKLPPQLAKVILEKKEIKPPPKPKIEKPETKKKEEPKPEKPKETPKPEPKPEPKPKPKPKIEPKPKEPPKATVQQQVKKAREKAKKSGLLALQDDLADMRTSVDTKKLAIQTDLKAQTVAAKAEGITTAKALAGSGGIETNTLATPAADSVQVASRDLTQLDETADERTLGAAEAELAFGERKRSQESLDQTFARMGVAFEKIFVRESRKDPFMEGALVLEVVIEASGEVSYCRVVSSELNKPSFEKKIQSRCYLEDFGAEDVPRETVENKFSFIPA